MKGCRPTAIDQKRTTANTVFTYSIRVISLASLSSVADITPPAAVAGRGNGIALSALLDARRIWKGQSAVPAGASLPTGHARLDALLPGGGWPEHALSEILHARDGVGELQLLMPTLARLTQAQRRVVLVGAPYVPYPQAWLAAAVDLRHLVLLQASGRDALWAAEQCLRSGSCAAVLCWPQQADDRALRRLQVAAESGQALGFAYRPCAKRSILRRQRYACASKPAPTPAHPQVPGRPRAGDRPAGQRLAMRRPCSGLAFSCRNWPWTARCVNGAIPTHRWRCSAAQRSAGGCRRSTLRHARSA